jgi:GIY-YIG catalytic domain
LGFERGWGFLPAGRQGIPAGSLNPDSLTAIGIFYFGKMKYYVYVIKSDVDGRLYKGMTVDLKSRLQAHYLLTSPNHRYKEVKIFRAFPRAAVFMDGDVPL